MTKIEIINIIKKNRNLLEKYEVKTIALFGSYVRGDATQESDIDLLVEFKNYIGLLREYKFLFNKNIDLVCKDGLKDKIKPYILGEAEEVA